MIKILVKSSGARHINYNGAKILSKWKAIVRINKGFYAKAVTSSKYNNCMLRMKDKKEWIFHSVKQIFGVILFAKVEEIKGDLLLFNESSLSFQSFCTVD